MEEKKLFFLIFKTMLTFFCHVWFFLKNLFTFHSVVFNYFLPHHELQVAGYAFFFGLSTFLSFTHCARLVLLRSPLS